MKDYREYRDNEERRENRDQSSSRAINGGRNNRNAHDDLSNHDWDDHEKRTPTTKRLVVPAGDVLKCIAADKEVTYPVHLTVVDRLGGSSYQLNSREDLLGITRADAVKDANLVRISNVKGMIHADVAKDGWYTTGLGVFPEYADKQMVMPDDTRKLYLAAVCR